MALLGIGFVLLCYYWGKAELVEKRTKALLAMMAHLPEEERVSRAREFISQNAKL